MLLYKVRKKLEFENKRSFFFEFLIFHFIKLGKKLEFENKRGFFGIIMFYFIKLGKKLQFENKREKNIFQCVTL